MNHNLPLLSLIWNIPATTCICWAGYLASHEVGSWGWFMLAGVVLTVLPLGTINMAFQQKS